MNFVTFVDDAKVMGQWSLTTQSLLTDQGTIERKDH
jgi:hypothetical protein